MKTALRLIIVALGLALFNLSTAGVRAQFNYETNNGTITITKYTGPGGGVTIPGTINGLPVTSIGGAAFYDCTSLTSVLIPNSVTSIGEGAFGGCSRLTNVTIPDSVVNSGIFAFAGCGSLTNVTIGNSVRSIGGMAFANCTNLTGVCFEGNAASLQGPGVFDGDNNATVYFLPGTTGWGSTFGGRPTALWELPYPLILDFVPCFGIQTNAFGFIISWAANVPVVVEACTDLDNPVWSAVGTNTLTGGWSCFSDPEWTNYPSRFYRIRSP